MIIAVYIYFPLCSLHFTFPLVFFSRHLSQRIDSTLPGYDIVIMSDLLHFDSSHDVLVLALTSLLAKSSQARVYVAAGNYTAPHVCDNFLNLGTHAGLIWEVRTNDRSDGHHAEMWRVQ